MTTHDRYTTLRDLLAAGKWKEADQETGKVMCQVAGRESEECLRKEDIDNFSCQDLLTINQLWLHYSNGKFGFSVQKEIYERLDGTRDSNVEGTRDSDVEVWKRFGDRVGWRKGGKWLSYSDLTFNVQLAPEGYLPCAVALVVPWHGRVTNYLALLLFLFLTITLDYLWWVGLLLCVVLVLGWWKCGWWRGFVWLWDFEVEGFNKALFSHAKTCNL